MNELELLEHAVSIIRGWHGEEVFDIYYRHSPEMKPIRERIDELKAAAPPVEAGVDFCLCGEKAEYSENICQFCGGYKPPE